MSIPAVIAMSAAALMQSAAEEPARSALPPPPEVIEGDGGTTLLVFDSAAKPFSLVDEIAPFRSVLSRFGNPVKALQADEVTEADLDEAARIVVVGVAGVPAPDAVWWNDLRATRKPVLGAGWAAARVAGRNSGAAPEPVPAGHATVRYRGASWSTGLDPFFHVATNNATSLAMAMDDNGAWNLAWRDGKRFGFAALPGEGPLAMILSDVLVDFHNGNAAGPAGIVLVVENFHPGSDPAALRRLTDYLHHRNLPFALTTQMRELPPGSPGPMPRDEFLDSLKRASRHGARIHVRGDSESIDAEKLAAGDIEVTGFEFDPGGPPGLPEECTVIGNRMVARASGRAPVPFRSHTTLPLDGGSLLIPKNLRGGRDGLTPDELKAEIRRITSMRGGIAGVVVPAWLPFQEMREIVDAAVSTGVPVLDPVLPFNQPTP